MTNGEFKIEKGVPIPGYGGGGKTGSKYPWAELEIDDSFFVDCTGPDTPQAKYFGRVCYDAGKRLSRKFATRITDGGVRIWRVS